jgi:hypothetical protein
MTWNYRVIVYPEDGYLAVHEVYYDKGKPKYWTEGPTGVSGYTKGECLVSMKQMADAFNKPFLTIKGKKLVKYK